MLLDGFSCSVPLGNLGNKMQNRQCPEVGATFSGQGVSSDPEKLTELREIQFVVVCPITWQNLVFIYATYQTREIEECFCLNGLFGLQFLNCNYREEFLAVSPRRN